MHNFAIAIARAGEAALMTREVRRYFNNRFDDEIARLMAENIAARFELA